MPSGRASGSQPSMNGTGEFKTSLWHFIVSYDSTNKTILIEQVHSVTQSHINQNGENQAGQDIFTVVIFPPF